MSDEKLTELAQAHVDRVYVATADARQKAMGLAYITAERQDLAREIVRCLADLRAAGYLLIPTEGPEWDAALERMFAALPSDAQGLIGSGEMERIMRAAGRVEL